MAQFKGTPGPWSLDEFDNVVHGEEPLLGRGRKETVRVSGVALPGRVTEEYAANTRLVAAAPELLEALQTIQQKMSSFITLANEIGINADDGFYLHAAMDAERKARAAINKATGETK